jgi:hypothetical protein
MIFEQIVTLIFIFKKINFSPNNGIKNQFYSFQRLNNISVCGLVLVFLIQLTQFIETEIKQSNAHTIPYLW